MQETRGLIPGWEDPLEKETAPHSSLLAWEISWIEEPDGDSARSCKRIWYKLATKQQQQALWNR